MSPFKLSKYSLPVMFSLQRVLDEGDQRGMNGFSCFHKGVFDVIWRVIYTNGGSR